MFARECAAMDGFQISTTMASEGNDLQVRFKHILGQGVLVTIFSDEALDRQEFCDADVLSFGLGAPAMKADGHPYGETEKNGANNAEACNVYWTKGGGVRVVSDGEKDGHVGMDSRFFP